MRFIDEISLEVKAGAGGDGAIAFRRERFKPKGGPAGGDGGRGGDVVLRASRNLGTLIDLRYRPQLVAGRGENGGGKDCHGRGAEPLVIAVPVGTTVHDADDDALVGDLIADGQELVVAAGGRGGRGNMRFVTPSNRAPRKAEPGEPGEQRTLRLELKLLADVGLVGLPNVGKSTMISRLSAARPKIADYPFTTLVPNLGVVEVGPGESFVMADIPGLVRGAADGAGLGSRFLKHVQRTGILLHLVAPNETEDNDLLADFDDLRAEIESFDEELARRPHLVALNKADLPATKDAAPDLEAALAARGIELLVCSAVTGEGLDELRGTLARKLAEREDEADATDPASSDPDS